MWSVHRSRINVINLLTLSTRPEFMNTHSDDSEPLFGSLLRMSRWKESGLVCLSACMFSEIRRTRCPAAPAMQLPASHHLASLSIEECGANKGAFSPRRQDGPGGDHWWEQKRHFAGNKSSQMWEGEEEEKRDQSILDTPCEKHQLKLDFFFCLTLR